MVFVYRAAIMAVATFVSALIGFGMQWLLPAAYVVESKGMVGSVVGLVGSLLTLVLSLLIWTSHGLFTTQQSQRQTIGSSIIRLDFTLRHYGAEGERGRALLREHVKRVREGALNSRIRNTGSGIRLARLRIIVNCVSRIVPNRSLASDEQRQALATVPNADFDSLIRALSAGGEFGAVFEEPRPPGS